MKSVARNRIDLTGRTFGRWTVIGVATPGKNMKWKCRCKCGTERDVSGRNLRGGLTTSCGCRKDELTAQRNREGATHGMCGQTTFNSWRALMSRCRSRNDVQYKSYGGRGILVCENIASSPRNLLALLGARPPRDTIERIDNGAHYSCGKCPECLKNGWPLNVRWATRGEQNRNTRQNRNITIDGVVRCAADWADIYGIPRYLVRSRMHRGWPQARWFEPKRK